MKSIIYSRVSSSSQSTARQINELSSIEGFEVVKVFTESISGYTRSASERPQLQKAVKYALDNNVEVIMVHEISRLGRRTIEVLSLFEELKEKGIKVFVKSLGFTINGNGQAEAINKLIVTLMADLARMESEQLSFRIKSGLEERKRQGYAVGRRYGSKEKRENFLTKHKKVIHYLKNGESIRWIATQMQISPTTVIKVKHLINIPA